MCTKFDFNLCNNIFTCGKMLKAAGDFSEIKYIHTMCDHKHYKKGDGKVGGGKRKRDRKERGKLESN